MAGGWQPSAGMGNSREHLFGSVETQRAGACRFWTGLAGQPRAAWQLLLPVPEPGPPAQRALPGLQGLRPAPGPPLPAAGALRGLQQLPALPVPAAPRGRPAAARHGPAGPGPGPPAAGALPAARRDAAAAAVAHAAHRWRVPGPVRPGLHSRHVRGGRPALWGRAPLPRDAAAARPDHPRVGPRAAPLRPGPPEEHGGRPGLPLAPGVALALPVLPAARGRHHLPDRRLRSVARGEHGLGAEERRGPLPACLSSPGLRPHSAGLSPPPSCLTLKPRIRSSLALPPRPGPGRAVGPSPHYNKALKLLLPLRGGCLWGSGGFVPGQTVVGT
ncbi:probable palmitoyltransferase ZDHHC24 isoform X1 [Antechinus flavipes]|uniref:probable palmitoyltransferase ZDHHC24 isoform X1 n=1 Tax=Antechinus flavipes TaxID=38775 RepID=UPI002236AC73|nr:probable palmitoyltransferase ZDHHC24 isoform X1 [Antechinus flavipes]